MAARDDVDLPHYVIFQMLDGCVYLNRNPIVVESDRMMINYIDQKGMFKRAFLLLLSTDCEELIDAGKRVHAHYIRYIEVWPPSLEGATVH